MSFTIEKLQQDLAMLTQKREQTLSSFHQLVGAVSIVEQMIERLQNPVEDTEDKGEENGIS